MAKKNKIKKIKRKVRRSTLFFLIFAFMANAFAWFIYSNKVSNQLTTGVKSWKITFEQDGNDLTDNIFFEKGVFLLDFSQIVNNHQLFIEMVQDLKFTKIYVENSKHYNILPVVEKLTNVEVILMNFGSEESGK